MRAKLAMAGVGVLLLAGAGAAVLVQRGARDRAAAEQAARKKDREGFVWREGQLRRGDLSPGCRVGAVAVADGEWALRGPSDRPALKLPVGEGAAEEGAKPGPVTLKVKGGKAEVVADPPVLVNAQPQRRAELAEGDTVFMGRLRLMYSRDKKGGAVLLVHDPAVHKGNEPKDPRYYPFNPGAVVAGQLEKGGGPAVPERLRVELSRGGPRELHALGWVRFRLRGVERVWGAYQLGVTGAGAGGAHILVPFSSEEGRRVRLLVGTVESGGAVRLDFNQAFYPPCAYAWYYDCPEVPGANQVGDALQVGEQPVEKPAAAPESKPTEQPTRAEVPSTARPGLDAPGSGPGAQAEKPAPRPVPEKPAPKRRRGK